ncbi:MAG: hypothetical protein M1457_07645, partial [bacterium]|nr:hypothetical protein [bacterium]
MSSISSIASVVSPAITTAQSTAGTGTVSKDEFLRLLVTQLQKQDPLNPQDPSEFTSQLAQFSSLEQLISIGEGLDALTSQQALG